ncbi:hypothetical protein CWATWH0402_4240 [Crocosphaera watsonii WH 0402]|uniref:Uncharacterized protein n=1 Tax=Crocosphaera watsonii WH 0402 TaxID=1284629 RepID=T2JZ73_CROWT|nr:hypothetical protein CWATWH0402_4240 [Crocosphaera watsonii WH 0402]
MQRSPHLLAWGVVVFWHGHGSFFDSLKANYGLSLLILGQSFSFLSHPPPITL